MAHPVSPFRTQPPTDGLPEFYRGYVARVPTGDVVQTLERQVHETVRVLSAIPTDREVHRYRPDAWSMREVVGHMTDTERVFQYRALSLARMDPAPLPPMDQDRWVEASGAHHRPLASHLDEFQSVRRSTVLLLEGLEPEGWAARGVANELPFAMAAIPWILAGHELHHLEVLKTRYHAVPSTDTSS
ncbi:MAG: DinB family protein [Gemmatimonadota bacterium]